MESSQHFVELTLVLNKKHGGFSLSERALDLLEERGALPLIPRIKEEDDDNYRYRRMRKLERTDPQLIQVVQELGAAAGRDLRVETVRLPYYIHSYDGYERVVTDAGHECLAIDD